MNLNKILKTEQDIHDIKYSFPIRNSNHLSHMMNNVIISKYKKLGGPGENETMLELYKKLSNINKLDKH